MSVTIERIGSYIPDSFISNFDRSEEFQVDKDFINEKLGIDKVSRRLDTQDTADLGAKAIDDLGEDFDPGAVDCLVVCTQNPHGNGIPHTSAVIHSRFGFPEHCACFDVGLGCSGYVYALSVTMSFMASNGMRKGLLVTSDPYSKILDPTDRNTAMLFGDGATATLLGSEGTLSPTLFEFGTCGGKGQALENSKGKLTMNGRSVFEFSVTKVPRQIMSLLEKAGLEKEQVDYYLFHQGSRFIVDQLTKRLGLPLDKVPLELKNHGNTVSSTIPLLLKNYLNPDNGKIFLLSGFGVGLSWASCLLNRNS